MPTKSSRVAFRETTIAEALAAGIEDMAEANFREVELLQAEAPFKVHWGAYQMAERRGDFFGVGGWCKGDLVGYAGYMLQVPDHHAGMLWAFNRVLYMRPEFRGYPSLELKTYGETLALAKGARAIVQAVKEPNSTDGKRSANLTALLVRDGYVPYERHFIKSLGSA